MPPLPCCRKTNAGEGVVKFLPTLPAVHGTPESRVLYSRPAAVQPMRADNSIVPENRGDANPGRDPSRTGNCESTVTLFGLTKND
jgi:hypothetical protein